MPDTPGKRQRREVKAKRRQAREDRRAARHDRRGTGSGEDWLADPPERLADLGDLDPTSDAAEPEPEREPR
jgi:hypothetical protein